MREERPERNIIYKWRRAKRRGCSLLELRLQLLLALLIALL